MPTAATAPKGVTALGKEEAVAEAGRLQKSADAYERAWTAPESATNGGNLNQWNADGALSMGFLGLATCSWEPVH